MSLINKKDKCYSLRDQCLLLDINHSTLYYKPVGINPVALELMDLPDKQYTSTPFYGVLRMRQFLKSKGYLIGKEHVRTLLRIMGLCAVFPRPKISNSKTNHKIFKLVPRFR